MTVYEGFGRQQKGSASQNEIARLRKANPRRRHICFGDTRHFQPLKIIAFYSRHRNPFRHGPLSSTQIQPKSKTNMRTGNGKIANLPAQIREELNCRIDDGEQGAELVEWLNAIPEVTEVINERFGGHPVSEQNLSEWRKRGFQQWLTLNTILDGSDTASESASEVAKTGINCERLLLLLTARYAEMIQSWNLTDTELLSYKMGLFRRFTAVVLSLRRAELQKARLEIDRERLELLREKQRNKSTSSLSSRVSASADSASPESAPSSSPTRTEAPESHRPVAPVPSSGEESDAPHPTTAGSSPEPLAADVAPHSAPSQERRETSIATPKSTAPTAPREALFSPSPRLGALPRNANPRNPLGLL